MRPYRGNLLWLGPGLTDSLRSACDERGLLPVEVTIPIPVARLSSARGLIIRWPYLQATGEQIGLPEVLRDALRHGVAVAVLCALTDVPEAGRAFKQLGVWRRIRLLVDGRKAIEEICRVEPAASWAPIQSMRGAETLKEEDAILLQRAFGDCTQVCLIPQSAGSKGVYQVHANLSDSRAGPLALPFFVKFGKLQNIQRELQNYRECTALHVPFNQRPNLDPDRCAFGMQRGVIVGNFVEQSEALQELIDRGAGRQALHSLFHGALRGWRQQAYFDENRYVWTGSLTSDMDLCCPSNYSEQRRQQLRDHAHKAQQFGTTLSFEELERRLKALPAIRYRRSLTHGDLHGENVRVAGQDAILIDFASVAEGPLVADPASLDVSMAMDTKTLLVGWDAVVDGLYRYSALRTLPSPLRPEDPGAALVDAIRFVRQIAFADQLNEFEYPIAVALQLLRKASYKAKIGEDPQRRVQAFAMAEQLVLEIEARQAVIAA
jgi:hypothetical protein